MIDDGISRMIINSPLGSLTVSEQDGAIIALDWRTERPTAPTPLLRRAAVQLAEYFAGQRKSFDLPLAWWRD
jgi:methylated-DNA-[protein]-cysteine S-methyltransferase